VSATKKGESREHGSHLSQSGVEIARAVGASLVQYDLVLSSCIPRTLETALSMGFAVDRQVQVVGYIPLEVHDEVGHHDLWAWDCPFEEFARLRDRGGPAARMGRIQVEAWIEALNCVREGGSVLIISHGRVIEAGLVTAVSGGSYASWGKPFGHCEGVRLNFDAGRFTDVDIVRLHHPAD
jgi:broad specificity phosphatase PhoE